MSSASLAEVLGSSSGSLKDKDEDDEVEIPEPNGPGGAYPEDDAEGEGPGRAPVLPSLSALAMRCELSARSRVYMRCLHVSEW